MSDCSVCGSDTGFYSGAQHVLLMSLGVEWEMALGGGAFEYGLKNGDTIKLEGKCEKCDVETVLKYSRGLAEKRVGVKVPYPA